MSRTAALVLRAAEQRDQPVDLAPDHDAEVSTHLHTAPEHAGGLLRWDIEFVIATGKSS